MNGGTLILLAAMFVLLWVLLIRPQKRKQAEQQQLLSGIEPGDEVLTVGGIYGIVHEIDEDDDLVVEIAEASAYASRGAPSPGSRSPKTRRTRPMRTTMTPRTARMMKTVLSSPRKS